MEHGFTLPKRNWLLSTYGIIQTLIAAECGTLELVPYNAKGLQIVSENGK